MSKTKTVNGKNYRWDYQKKRWVRSHGASGGESLGGLVRSIGGLFNRDKAKIKTNSKSNNKTKVTDHKDTGHTKLVKGSDGKVRRVKVSDKTTDKTIKGSDTRQIKSKDPNAKYTPKKGSAAASIRKKLIKGGHTQKGLNEKAARHAAWKKARKEGTLGDWEKKYHPDRTPEYRNKKKKTPVSKGPAPKLDKKQQTQLKTEKKVKLKVDQIPKDKVKMKDGSIVDRSSLYKKKKKKQDLNFTTM